MWAGWMQNGLLMLGQLLKQGKDFIEQVYIPDLKLIASFYKD